MRKYADLRNANLQSANLENANLDKKLHPLLGWSFWAWGMGHGEWGMGHGAWGMGHGEEVTCLANAQCPKRRGDYPSPPTLGLEFPVAFNDTSFKDADLRRAIFIDALDISEKECRDAKFRVSTRVLDNAYLIYGDVYYINLTFVLPFGQHLSMKLK
ncbi:pentapeptide repeat-containing protein [Nostoc sp.]|uniref:pentapeptide repeat-containing protein n=3 Tax=Nostoc TaxID=1177 RepID=UPI002FFB158F